ncbi:EamA family transporter [Shimwellia pseudoproteus]|uniref:EamA family transporter n=1 Tax=Shimwellia pseudoproteus TaxID=570012 RepID=UPI0018EDF0CC|nr:EamA family transporter [Shimwellia pseudoproteus]MBJ3815833.1 EamA family transporter [Shimwellia pseudoproteus]
MLPSRKGIICVLLAAILWGSSGVCAQYIMENNQVSAGWLTMLRLLFSGVIILALAFFQGEKLWHIFSHRRDTLRLAAFSLFGALAVQLTFLATIAHTNAATATVLQFLSPTLIVVWFALRRKQLPGIRVASAVAVSLIGTFLLVTHGALNALSISVTALVWGIASAIAAAFYTTYPSPLIARYGTLSIVGWSMLLAGLMLAPFALQGSQHIAPNGGNLFAFLYLIVIGTAVNFTLYLKGAQLIGGQKASILSCAEPLSSALLSVVLLGVSFTVPDWLGTLCIVGSVVLIALEGRGRLHHGNRKNAAGK